MKHPELAIVAIFLIGAAVLLAASLAVAVRTHFVLERWPDAPWSPGFVWWPCRISGRWIWLKQIEERRTELFMDGFGLFGCTIERRLPPGAS